MARSPTVSQRDGDLVLHIHKRLLTPGEVEVYGARKNPRPAGRMGVTRPGARELVPIQVEAHQNLPLPRVPFANVALFGRVLPAQVSTVISGAEPISHKRRCAMTVPDSDGPPQQTHYGFETRTELEYLIPRATRSALDVGCAEGGFSLTLRAALGPSARLVGIDAVPEVAQTARDRGQFDEVLSGYFPRVLEGAQERFDLVVFNDVLEHLMDPWDVLARTHDVLTPEGRVLASIPNVRFVSVLLGLAKGRFDYEGQGVLDRTHLRFFTKDTIEEMFTGAGFTVDVIDGINNMTQIYTRRFRGRRAVFRHLFGEAQWQQFAVLARPSSGS